MLKAIKRVLIIRQDFKNSYLLLLICLMVDVVLSLEINFYFNSNVYLIKIILMLLHAKAYMGNISLIIVPQTILLAVENKSYVLILLDQLNCFIITIVFIPFVKNKPKTQVFVIFKNISKNFSKALYCYP